MLYAKKLLGVCALLAALGACATPEVVQTRQTADRSLACEQLIAEISEAERLEQEARRERGLTGKNVAAALFFWPALLGTYSNTDDAIQAARGRQQHLTQVYEQKGCGVPRTA